jgi:uncharacterized protein DUF6677
MSEKSDTAPETIMLAPDPIEAMRERGKKPEIAGGLAWLIPGAGHFYAGHKIKGVLAFVLIGGLFLAGVVRSRGECVSLRKPDGHQFAFMAQIGAGLPTLAALAYDGEKIPGLTPGYKRILRSSHEEYSHQVPRSETGLLFTMIAGLLNMLLVWDALSGVPGGTQRRINEARRKRKLDALREEIGAKAGGAPAEEGVSSAKDEAAPEGEAEPAAEPSAEETPAAAAETSGS